MRTCWILGLVTVLTAASAVLGGPKDKRHATPKDMASTPLISRTALFGNPDRASAQISPDGTKLAFLAEVDGVMNVWVAPIDKPAAARPVTKDKKRGIRGYAWAYNNRHIGYVQDKDGDENWHIYISDLETNETTDLTPIDGVQARLQHLSYKFPNEVLVGINDRNPQLHDLYRLNVETNERKLIQRNDGYVGFATDDDFNVRLATKVTPDGGKEIFKATGEGKAWTSFMKISADDVMTTGAAGFDKSGRVLYMTDSTDRNTAALVAYNLDTDVKKVLAADPRADVGMVMAHPTENTIEAVSFTYERRKWKILDKSIKGDLDYLKTVADGEVYVTSRTLDDQHWIVVYIMDNGPVRYYHYDRAARKAKFLFTNRRELEGLPLTRMHPVVIKSRDGLNLVSYLSLPVWTDQDGDGRPEKPLPMVLSVHGGPWHRDTWGYNPMDQWLTNRGYAVLSVNFRGSTGLGKDFVNAANLEWGRKMHDDLIDAVNWAIDQRIAQPKRVAIMGGSYGGYATLAGLTFTPDVFACGVDIVGPSNLITLMKSIPPYWKPMLDLWMHRVGDYRTEEGQKMLTERSPLTYVDRISKPLLIGQGANDPRVKQAEADQIVKAMEDKNIPVSYVLFPDEGHGFGRPENRLAFNAVAEAFLSKHLGGRYEPIGDDFAGSSITVPKGAELVPGLPAALPE